MIKTTFLIVSLILSLGCSKSASTIPKDEGKPISGDVKIVWENASTKRKVSSSLNNEKYCGYARLIELKDKSLICIYESDGKVVVVKSTNKGSTWGSPTLVAPAETGINMTVPDILQLADGSLLAMYNPRPHAIDPSRRFAIRTRKSYDNGKVWKDERVLYEAGYQFANGCWEPSAIQLPSGQIQLFFANEGIYTQSNEQNISMVRSDDNGLTWTENPEIVSFRPGSRDGMPAPLLLKDKNEVVIAIEDNGNTNFKPFVIRNTLTENWKTVVGASSSNRSSALKEPLANAIYAGAPYLRQLSTGEIIMSYQGTENRSGNTVNQADMKVVIGDSNASNFGKVTVPFNIPLNRTALWNSVSVLSDDEVVALTSTNAFGDGRTEVWMIKGKIVRE